MLQLIEHPIDRDLQFGREVRWTGRSISKPIGDSLADRSHGQSVTPERKSTCPGPDESRA
jgi:hypothetical protein